MSKNPKVTFPPFCPQGDIHSRLVHFHFNDFVFGLAFSWDYSPELSDGAEMERFIREQLVPIVRDSAAYWGSGNLWLSLTGGISNPKLCPTGPYRPYPEKRKWKRPQAVSFVHEPPFWVKSSAIVDGQLKLDKMAEEVFRAKLTSSEIQLKVTRDGQFTFDFSEWEPGALPIIDAANGLSDKAFIAEVHGRRIDAVNVFLACLYSAQTANGGIIRTMEVTPGKLATQLSLDERGGSGVAKGAARALLDARKKVTLPPYADWRIADRVNTITAGCLESAATLFDDIVSRPPERGLERVVLYLRAVNALSLNHFSLSLVLSWFVCESLISQLWMEYIKGFDRPLESQEGSPSERFLSGFRKEHFLDGEYTASMMTEVLSLHNKIPNKLTKSCRRIRKARNKFAHELRRVDEPTARVGIDCAEQLLKLVEDLTLKIPVFGSYSAQCFPALSDNEELRRVRDTNAG